MKETLSKLSRRERQIMELIYRNGQSTVADIQREIPDKLTYSSVRTLMTILENKGFLKHKKQGRAYVYSPTVNHKQASSAALKQVVNTFFDGSVENVVAALISLKSSDLTEDEFERLSRLIESKRNGEK